MNKIIEDLIDGISAYLTADQERGGNLISPGGRIDYAARIVRARNMPSKTCKYKKDQYFHPKCGDFVLHEEDIYLAQFEYCPYCGRLIEIEEDIGDKCSQCDYWSGTDGLEKAWCMHHDKEAISFGGCMCFKPRLTDPPPPKEQDDDTIKENK